ncbi:hypothetical protein BC830DRAFT_527050 [Chytriomyces sp. MP71]|nr:hypothetical protein BC830DRAFT_527050 [Chytriomyces sp. MP71]
MVGPSFFHTTYKIFSSLSWNISDLDCVIRLLRMPLRMPDSSKTQEMLSKLTVAWQRMLDASSLSRGQVPLNQAYGKPKNSASPPSPRVCRRAREAASRLRRSLKQRTGLLLDPSTVHSPLRRKSLARVQAINRTAQAKFRKKREKFVHVRGALRGIAALLAEEKTANAHLRSELNVLLSRSQIMFMTDSGNSVGFSLATTRGFGCKDCASSLNQIQTLENTIAELRRECESLKLVAALDLSAIDVASKEMMTPWSANQVNQAINNSTQPMIDPSLDAVLELLRLPTDATSNIFCHHRWLALRVHAFRFFFTSGFAHGCSISFSCNLILQ